MQFLKTFSGYTKIFEKWLGLSRSLATPDIYHNIEYQIKYIIFIIFMGNIKQINIFLHFFND